MKFTLLNLTTNEAILFEAHVFDTSISRYWFIMMLEDGRWKRTDLVNVVEGIVNDPVLNYIKAGKEDRINIPKILVKNALAAYKKRNGVDYKSPHPLFEEYF